MSRPQDEQLIDGTLALEEGRFRAAVDQWGSSLRPIAAVGAQFARSCVDEGFSREEAFQLVRLWAERHFDGYESDDGSDE